MERWKGGCVDDYQICEYFLGRKGKTSCYKTTNQ